MCNGKPATRHSPLEGRRRGVGSGGGEWRRSTVVRKDDHVPFDGGWRGDDPMWIGDVELTLRHFCMIMLYFLPGSTRSARFHTL